jgi:mRNA interferase RelE/StbE
LRGYSLLFADKAQKQLSKLSKINASCIIDKGESIKGDPYRYVEGCEGYPYFHERIGNYRVILDVNDTDRIIEVLKVGLRKNVYDR